MKYKLHITHAGEEERVLKAARSVLDIGRIHLWANGIPAPRSLWSTQWQEFVTPHETGPVTTVSLINMCIRSSWSDDVMFWMHDDAYAHPGVATKFFRIVEEKFNSGERWGALFTHYDAFCAFNMAAVREVGYWDTMFYQYTADIDYYRRLHCAEWPVIDLAMKAEVEHYGSSVVRANNLHAHCTAFRDRTNFDHEYYKFKWGGVPGREKWGVPFQNFDPTYNVKNAQWEREAQRKGLRA